MIKHWLITGDTHGRVTQRLDNIDQDKYPTGETAIIILGDVGLNFYLNKTDYKLKNAVNRYGYLVYCLRGNHEARPENLNMELKYDALVRGDVYMEEEFSNIRYLTDGGMYTINGKSILTIGGAYSVDKWYRLQRAAAAGSSFSGWFPDEQLSEEEMAVISSQIVGKHFDFVFTHTCPMDWEPTDLFLSSVDQSSVDKSMGNWLNQVKNSIDWGIWCFGHYHADRLEWPHVEQYYTDIESMEQIISRWETFDRTGELNWWKECSPKFQKKNWR